MGSIDFKILIKKINGTLSEKENIIFQEWLSESPSRLKYFKNLQANYNSAGSPKVNVNKAWHIFSQKLNRAKRKKYQKVWTAAAGILLFVGVGSWFAYNALQEDKIVPNEFVLEPKIYGGKEDVLLTMDDGKEMYLTDSILVNQKGFKGNNASLVYDSNLNTSQKIAYNTITVPRGGQFYVQLSDSTRVWLNSETKIKYPVSFVPGEKRQISLVYGEIFLEVTSAEKVGGTNFVVAFNNQEIEVLGTSFNIKSYTNDVNSYTTLVEGRIAITAANEVHQLKPHEQAIFNKNKASTSIQRINVFDAVSWRLGVFGFSNKPLEEIMQTLARWYDVEVVFKNEQLKQKTFNGSLHKKAPLHELLNLISGATGVVYSVENKIVTLK